MIPIHAFGKKGEEAVVQYLRKKGHKIIATNYSSRFGEVDIISSYKNILIFTEVKSRRSRTFGAPAEAVTSKKLNSIIATSNIFMSKHRNLPEQVRYDVIEVSLGVSDELEFEHLENVTL